MSRRSPAGSPLIVFFDEPDGEDASDLSNFSLVENTLVNEQNFSSPTAYLFDSNRSSTMSTPQPTRKPHVKAVKLDFSNSTCFQLMQAFSTPDVKALNPLESRFTVCYDKMRLGKHIPGTGGRDLTTLVRFWLEEENFTPRPKKLTIRKKVEMKLPIDTPDRGIYKLNYDELREVCDQLTLRYPAIPIDCSRGTVFNDFTGQEEHHLELNSGAYNDILTVLKGVDAHRDMINLASSCKHLYQLIKPCLDATRRLDRHRRPLRIESIWFEDLSWMVSCLNSFAFSNISTVSLTWDNRTRFTGSMRAPPQHRGAFAAATTFDTLAKKCDGLRTLDIQIAPNLLCTKTADGQTRSETTQSVLKVAGMKALKKLIQVVMAKEEGGQVNIRIALGDYELSGLERVMTHRSIGHEENQALLKWLKDGEVVEEEATFA